MAEHAWMQEVRKLVGREYGRVYGWDPVNSSMGRQWCEVMGIKNPIYTDSQAAHESVHARQVVPPAMLQVWCMEGMLANNYPPRSTTENPYEALGLIEAQGYPAVVAVNSEVEFNRYLSPDESLYYTTRLDSVGEEKTTGLGTGYFVTLIMNFFSEREQGDEAVGKLLFRVFKFRPAQAVPQSASQATTDVTPPTIRKWPVPGVSDDNRFFWEGVKNHTLLIQRCTSCQTLRHPPGPVCPHCHSFEWDTLAASGRGSIYSYVVMHYPEVPPFSYPNPIALVELEEGTRLVAQLTGIQAADIHIGQAVEVEYQIVSDELTLPLFRPRANV